MMTRWPPAITVTRDNTGKTLIRTSEVNNKAT
jgi:hypothetical protein